MKGGENGVGVEVLGWCEGCYVECEDMLGMSGMLGDVYLYNVGKVRVGED